MTKPLKIHSISFVLRVWAEFLTREPPQLRGEIENVENKQRIYFSKLEDIQQFIKKSAVETQEK
ncbi:MAG: hypothetical protein CL609_17720 [Anaerolineaceae bacterium]|nr:hypothetical protein [Anaerolineaceae bacterium]